MLKQQLKTGMVYCGEVSDWNDQAQDAQIEHLHASGFVVHIRDVANYLQQIPFLTGMTNGTRYMVQNKIK